MVRKIQAKTILRLNAQGMSRRSVSDVLDAAKMAGVGWDGVADRPDDEVYALLFPGRGERESVHEQPDWAGGASRAGARGRDVEDPARRVR